MQPVEWDKSNLELSLKPSLCHVEMWKETVMPNLPLSIK